MPSHDTGRGAARARRGRGPLLCALSAGLRSPEPEPRSQSPASCPGMPGRRGTAATTDVERPVIELGPSGL